MPNRLVKLSKKLCVLFLAIFLIQTNGKSESGKYCLAQRLPSSGEKDTSSTGINTMPSPYSKTEMLIDQANEVLQKQYSYNIDFLKPIGQEFTPTLHALDAVELFIDDANCSETGGTGGSLKVVIHEGSIHGPVAGSSKVTSFQNCYYNIIRFEFPAFVPLTPGKKYVIEPVYVSGNTSTVYVDKGPAPLYKPGGLIFQGALDSEMDMWFREGLSTSIARREAQAKNGGWKKLVKADGTPFKSEKECLQYIKAAE